jgi:nucleoside-diphosphate-sugar epimerase
MNKVCLLTGAGGALGKAMQIFLKNKSYQVIVTTKVDGKNILDICDTDSYEKLIYKEKPNFIVHLAASFSNNFDEAFETNVNAVRRLLECIEINSIESRLVLIGSAAEYGIVRPEECPISEEQPLRPVSVYGLTKSWQTQLVTLYAAKGVNVVAARIFNLYGRGVSERLFAGRVQKQIDEVVAGDRAYIELGSLCSIRDYISLEEAASQITAIAEHGSSGQIYNVASGRAITMRELLVKYLTAANLDMSIVRESVLSSNRPGYDVPVIYADVTKTLKLMK